MTPRLLVERICPKSLPCAFKLNPARPRSSPGEAGPSEGEDMAPGEMAQCGSCFPVRFLIR